MVYCEHFQGNHAVWAHTAAKWLCHLCVPVSSDHLLTSKVYLTYVLLILDIAVFLQSEFLAQSTAYRISVRSAFPTPAVGRRPCIFQVWCVSFFAEPVRARSGAQALVCPPNHLQRLCLFCLCEESEKAGSSPYYLFSFFSFSIGVQPLFPYLTFWNPGMCWVKSTRISSASIRTSKLHWLTRIERSR